MALSLISSNIQRIRQLKVTTLAAIKSFEDCSVDLAAEAYRYLLKSFIALYPKPKIQADEFAYIIELYSLFTPFMKDGPSIDIGDLKFLKDFFNISELGYPLNPKGILLEKDSSEDETITCCITFVPTDALCTLGRAYSKIYKEIDTIVENNTSYQIFDHDENDTCEMICICAKDDVDLTKSYYAVTIRDMIDQKLVQSQTYIFDSEQKSLIKKIKKYVRKEGTYFYADCEEYQSQLRDFMYLLNTYKHVKYTNPLKGLQITSELIFTNYIQ
jgi:hypothetical protein